MAAGAPVISLPINKRAGFTLVELMIATLIFSMVIAGLSMIYSTVYRQGIRSLHDTRLKTMGFVTMKAIANELGEATLLTEPTFGSKGDILSGFKNCSETYEPGLCHEITEGGNQAKWFQFCTSNSGGDCDTETGLMCIWWYSGTGRTVAAPVCGLTGENRQLLAKGVDYDRYPGTPGAKKTAIFFRTAGIPAEPDNVNERNQVRVNFMMQNFAVNTNPSAPGRPTVKFSMDSTFNAQFADPP